MAEGLELKIVTLAVTQPMMNALSTAFFSLLIGSSALFSVTSLAQSRDTLTYFPADRIRGGAPAFYQTVSDHVSYPRSARNSKIVGTAIVALTVSPKGKLTGVDIVNSLGKEIDQTIRYAIKQTRDD